MVYRLIRNVRVKRTRSLFANYKDKRQHGISADLLAIKWRIGLDKAKRTLQSTTQDNVRSSLKPLTRRYRTGLLLQRLRRLNCRFYTDTLFAKDKSIVGNAYTQIFTNGGCFQIIPMISKSEAGTILENASGKTCYNTEMQRVSILARMEARTTDLYSPW